MNSDQTRLLARLHLDVAFALYQARERAGVTVKLLAERTELSPDRIVMIEQGDTTSLTEVAQLSEALEIKLTSLFSEATGRALRNARVP